VIVRPICTYSITLPLSDALSGQQKPPDRLYGAGFCATQHSAGSLLTPCVMDTMACVGIWYHILEVHGWPGSTMSAERSVCLLHVHKDRTYTVNVSDIVTEFVTAKDSRMTFFGVYVQYLGLYTVCMLHMVILHLTFCYTVKFQKENLEHRKHSHTIIIRIIILITKTVHQCA